MLLFFSPPHFPIHTTFAYPPNTYAQSLPPTHRPRVSTSPSNVQQIQALQGAGGGASYGTAFNNNAQTLLLVLTDLNLNLNLSS